MLITSAILFSLLQSFLPLNSSSFHQLFSLHHIRFSQKLSYLSPKFPQESKWYILQAKWQNRRETKQYEVRAPQEPFCVCIWNFISNFTLVSCISKLFSSFDIQNFEMIQASSFFSVNLHPKKIVDVFVQSSGNERQIVYSSSNIGVLPSLWVVVWLNSCFVLLYSLYYIYYFCQK